MSEISDPVDLQLIQLLAEKSAEELSFEELDLLRERLAVSPALRVAIAEHLRTESYLSQVLGGFAISPEQIITKAEAQQQASQTRPWQWLLGIVACALLVAVVGAVFLNALRTPDEQQLLAELEKKQRDEAAKEAVPEDEKKAVPAEVALTEQPAEPAVGTG
ncbi:MAG TPA: hypothetical protein VL096_10230, partial [Pirellulaceae bacterium]|nr:hypothetical protein [Pirellulaceae bacterium]